MNYCSQTLPISSHTSSINVYTAKNVDEKFKENICETMERLSCFSPKVQKAVSKLQNVLILKDSQTFIPDNFKQTKTKLNKYATDAYGFVCKPDRAIVINEKNHLRKDISLEGSVESQASDTLSHEIGHLVDKEYSTTKQFKEAYLKDLKNIEKRLHNSKKVESRNLKEMLVYLKHYMEGVDFSDGINKNDITREGLRENFAECFSTIVDNEPSKINKIYADLFPNTMKQTLNFVI